MINMNWNDNIMNGRKVGGDYFRLWKLKKSKYKLKDFIDLFDPDDYWIYKATRHQRLVSYNDFLEFRHAGYRFFRKSLYKKENIDIWIDWFVNLGGVEYINKPTPPFDPKKIIIKK